jgi:hypothetical protein
MRKMMRVATMKKMWLKIKMTKMMMKKLMKICTKLKKKTVKNKKTRIDFSNDEESNLNNSFAMVLHHETKQTAFNAHESKIVSKSDCSEFFNTDLVKYFGISGTEFDKTDEINLLKEFINANNGKDHLYGRLSFEDLKRLRPETWLNYDLIYAYFDSSKSDKSFFFLGMSSDILIRTKLLSED